MATSGPPIRSRGYTLIELLVVLVIVAVLVSVGISGLTPKTPKAVRGALFDMKSLIQEAREYAIQNGRDVTVAFTLDTSTKPTTVRFTGTVLIDNGTTLTPRVVLNRVMDSSSFRYATVATAKSQVSGANPGVDTLEAFKSLMGTASPWPGWDNNLTNIATATFAPNGTVLAKTAAGVRSTLGGCWIGVVGTNMNQKGVPMGVVFVSDDGRILAFFKSDSALNAPAEFLWQRME
ncbi:MAG TPA: prepilin-type N-terminal cleavage/methylation domain-containing protein [Geothrix sp.]|nr:prepilin-type N-terminal cleavage/methylation domain-containing protein [Geothrix sp.]